VKRRCESMSWRASFAGAVLLVMAMLVWHRAFGMSEQGQAQDGSANATHFLQVEIYLDPEGAELAAYQCELRSPTVPVRLVGIEGGAHPAFAEPPFYDLDARIEERIVLAAYCTQGALPRTKTLLARVHVEYTGAVKPQFTIEVQAAAKRGGAPFTPRIEVR
jgi:hypothetical protein